MAAATVVCSLICFVRRPAYLNIELASQSYIANGKNRIMKSYYKPTLEVEPKNEDLQLLGLGIDENNIAVTGESTGNRDIIFFIRNSDKKIIGGVRGTYNISGWLYVNGIWVERKYRNRGYGTMLLKSIESEAKKNGCSNCYLNTISFQAPDFYKKLGYEIFAELENFHQNYCKFFLRKKI